MPRRASDNGEKNEQETRRTSHCHSCRHQMQVALISSHSLPNSGIMQNACAHNTHPSNVFLARPRDNNPLGTSLHSTGDHFELHQWRSFFFPKGGKKNSAAGSHSCKHNTALFVSEISKVVDRLFLATKLRRNGRRKSHDKQEKKIYRFF